MNNKKMKQFKEILELWESEERNEHFFSSS